MIEYLKNFINENQELILGLIICFALCSIVFYKKIEKFNAFQELAERARKEEKESLERGIFCTQGCRTDPKLKLLFQKIAENNHKKYCTSKCINKITLKTLIEECNKEKCIKGRIAGTTRDNCIKNIEFTEDCLTQLFGNCALNNIM